MLYILINYRYNLLDNLIYYNESSIRDYADGFYTTLIKIGNKIFFYGSLIAKSKHTYKSIVPEGFRPKKDVQIIWNKIANTLYPIVLTIDTNGLIKTFSEYNNVVASGITIWEVAD